MTAYDDTLDPADHTVAEVTEFLAHATPEQVEAVQALEEDGKARTGILNWEPKPHVSKDGSDGYERVEYDPYEPGQPVDLETGEPLESVEG